MRRRTLLPLGIVGLVLVSAPAWPAGPFSGIQRGQDAKHTPVIEAPESVNAGEPFKVTITIGKDAHPSVSEHAIQWIALYAGEVELARATLTPTLTRAAVTFTIVLDEPTTLRALSAPNHSAAWEATKKIDVVKKLAQ